MAREITSYGLGGNSWNDPRIMPELPELVKCHEVTAYDLSEMRLNRDDIAIGTLHEARSEIPSFESNQ